MNDEMTGSYLKIRFRGENMEDRFLNIPTFWDPTNRQFIGYLQTPSKKMITFKGSTNQSLSDNFMIEFNKATESNQALVEEILDMLQEAE